MPSPRGEGGCHLAIAKAATSLVAEGGLLCQVSPPPCASTALSKHGDTSDRCFPVSVLAQGGARVDCHGQSNKQDPHQQW